MKREISHEFTFFQLFQFTLPSMAMLVITSLYTAVDGVFVARYVNSDALSAINIVLPLDFLLYGIAIMLGTGANAIIGRKLGQGKTEQARQNFTFITICAVVIGLLLTVFIILTLPWVLPALGASSRLMSYCVDYAIVLFLFSIPCIIQVMYQCLFVTAGKVSLAMWLTVACGVLNLFLDWLFMVVFDFGIAGAALGTGIGRLLGCIVPLIYFFKKRTVLYYVRPKWDASMLLGTMSNGSSEMVSNLASGITTLLFNLSMMKLAGEDGVAAVTIVLYTQFVYNSIYMGFTNSCAPVFSYHYGSTNHAYLQKLFRYSVYMMSICSFAMIVLSILFATPLISLFVVPDTPVFNLAYTGYSIFIWNFLFSGFNIFASGLFTAFSNGRVSAFISCLRTLVFVVGSILILPYFLKITGIWLSIPIAELFTFFVVIWLIFRFGNEPYHYLK